MLLKSWISSLLLPASPKCPDALDTAAVFHRLWAGLRPPIFPPVDEGIHCWGKPALLSKCCQWAKTPIAGAACWVSFPHKTRTLQKALGLLGWHFWSPGPLWLGLYLVGLSKGLCSGCADGPEPRGGWLYQLTSPLWASVSLKMKSVIPHLLAYLKETTRLVHWDLYTRLL